MNKTFTRYEVFLISILAFLQFTIILDFMVLSPLSAILLDDLDISTAEFGMVVSAYAWSAGASGLLAAGFADRYDRKKMLIFFYAGFVIGTFLCGLATDYFFLLVARTITGIFGGVIGSVVYATVTDVFPLRVRGRVMGYLQMAFAGASVLGLPIGLYLANETGWRSIFLMIAGLCSAIFFLITFYMRPVDAHVAMASERKPMQHLWLTISNRRYAKAFVSIVFMATGGFMLMPFGSAFAVNNLGVSLTDLPLLYLVTGVFAMVTAPMIGKLSDNLGKYIVFCLCSGMLVFAVIVYCNLPVVPFWVVVGFSILMFIGYSGRMVSSGALLSAVPEREDRGAFMSMNSAVNMISGGIASLIAGTIIHQAPDGRLENYDVLGYVSSMATILTVVLLYSIHKLVARKEQLAV